MSAGDTGAFSPTIGELDLHLLSEGRHRLLYRCMGGRLCTHEGQKGAAFTVWAPAARQVSVVGDFNGWRGERHPMRRLGPGVWECFIPDLGEGDIYKYQITGARGRTVMKADPFGRAMSCGPATPASWWPPVINGPTRGGCKGAPRPPPPPRR